MSDERPTIEFSDFEKVEMVTGTVLEARPNPEARRPAYVMRIDFGEFGVKTSSAQLTKNYTAQSLVGKQVVAVINFPSKRIAGVRSEVLVLGAVGDQDDVVLLTPDRRVPDGQRIA